ncbi:MAG: sensor domain-containing diguanylate cyclase [Negativicutes bacterium]|nr:sensor domain-containing diguanylate cyclase [Negativicutes bacterium]
MSDRSEQSGLGQLDARQLVRSLNSILAPSRASGEVLDTIVKEASAAVNCKHLFLSRYDPASKTFQAVAWRSSISPSNIALEQKFMGSSYLDKQPIIVNDLSQFNYRLRPAVARLGLLSLAGIPFEIAGGVIGVLEAFAEEVNHFSDFDIDCLTLFARQAAVVMEKIDLERENKLRSAENELLADALRLEQASLGSLLYKVGETFSALFEFDGIAAFGFEPEVEGSPLQEVMAKGFSMPDISRLKTMFNQELLEHLVSESEGKEHGIFKQTLRQPGPGGAKLLYTVPIIHKRTLYGIVVFYWKKADKDSDITSLEQFIKRIIGDITLILNRKSVYSNIQRVGFSDTLTGLPNRRLFNYILDREMKKAKRNQKPLSLLMIDIDFFKNINDSFGHSVGDVILEQIGVILRDSSRNADLPARFGGEEFTVVLPETDRNSAAAIAERVRERVAKCQVQIGKQCLTVTVSIGGATYDPVKETHDGDSLVQTADQALYQAKELGRNLVVFANTTKTG